MGLAYRARVAKTIERHMIVEAFRQFAHAQPDVDFRYVGFGALEFLDFDLVHRQLGLERMVSVERATNHARYLHNKPFRTVTVVPGRLHDVLETGELALDEPSLIWLDYEDQLDAEMVGDCQFVAANIPSPSMLVVTFNSRPGGDRASEHLTEFEEHIPEALRPNGVTGESLAVWGLSGVQRAILNDSLIEATRGRVDGARWQPTLYFRYRDGARMTSIGGEIGKGSLLTANLPFSRTGPEALELQVPVVTSRERHELDAQLPLEAGGELVHSTVPTKELGAYVEMYRYLKVAGLQSAVETSWTT